MDSKSSIDELQKKIYQKTVMADERPQEHLSSSPLPRPDVGWRSGQQKSFFMRNFSLFLASFFVIAIGAVLLILGTTSFSESNVEFEIRSPQEISGAEVTSFEVAISNKNRVDIEEVLLTFEYPENSLPLEDLHLTGRVSRVLVGTIEARGSASRVFKARLFGKEDDIKEVKASLTFKMRGISAQFRREAKRETKIISSPLPLTLKGPDEMQSAKQGLWTITFRNISDFDFAPLRVRVEYPEGFSLGQATPASQGEANNVWEVPSLKVGQEKTIEFTGTLTGAIEEEKIFQAFLEFPLEENQYILLTKKITASKITLAPLTLSLEVQNNESPNVKLGEELKARVTYKNNFSDYLNNLVLQVDLVGDAIDAKSIKTDGSFDLVQKRISWSPDSIPTLKALAPGEQGELSFSFKVKDKPPVRSFADKNFQIRLLGEIFSQNPPSTLRADSLTSKEELVLSLSTRLSLQIAGDYRQGPFANTGGIPPQVNKQTIYTVYWRLTNTSNEVKDLEVSAVLPSWASFTGVKKANFEEKSLVYDEEKRQMVWTIDSLPATTGIALPVYEGAFQIAVSPESSQVGSIVDILGSAEVKGIDGFTNEVIDLLYPPLKTDLAGKFHEGQARVIQ
ncbi:MAG: hypothetical protein HY001_02075 [Candidatus Portnoybacteria bacterium]|nr:hypothetical protein [Candidatus Portnoybacteria bacterium]